METEKNIIKLYCPNCGNNFDYEYKYQGKVAGGVSGILAGAYFGAQVGIAMGPLGAIAGTVPGAILGGIFGKNFGDNLDKPTCPKCRTSFKINNFDFFNFGLKDEQTKSQVLTQKWSGDFSIHLKEILEIHVIFSIFKINLNFDSSIHHQYEKHFGKAYAFQNNIEYKPLLSLKKLNLRTSEYIENISFIQYLKNIEELTYFCDSKNINGIEFIGSLVNLKFLHLYSPTITDLDFLKNNSQLQELSLIIGEINNWKFLSSLTNLKKLFCSIDNLEKNHPLFDLLKLEELDICNCSNVENLNDFIRLNKLKKLIAHYLNLNQIEFLKSMNLNKLNARRGELTDKEIEWIKENIENSLLL